MALTEEQRNPWRAIVAGGDYNLSSQDWEDLLTELDSLYAEAPITQPASAPSEQKPVAVCDTKNRIRWSGEDHNHRYSSAPSWVEVGTEFYATPQHDYKAQRDTERLDYLQVNGATVSLVHLKKPSDFEFCVGGLYKSINRDLRTAIDTAIASVKGGA